VSVDKGLALATRLDLQTAVFVGLRPPLLAVDSIYQIDKTQGFEQADVKLTHLTSRVCSFLRTKADSYRYRNPGFIPLDLIMEANDLRDQLDLFQRQNVTGKSTSVEAVMNKAYLQVKCLTGVILVATSLYAEEAIYDQFTSEFITIVDNVSQILTQSGSGTHTLHTGVIHPLYLTAAKCRSWPIRRRAIQLLDSLTAWDAQLYAKISRRIMHLEEACLDEACPTNPAAVPEWHRIHSADVDACRGGKWAQVTFRCRPNGMDGEWSHFSEIISL
jgi:hypothetical protein